MFRTEMKTDDEEDYQLPSLSERVQAALKFRDKLKPVVLSSDSDDKEHEVLKSSKNVRIKKNYRIDESSSDEEFSNILKKVTETPKIKAKKPLQEKFDESVNVGCTPKCLNRKNYGVGESDSDEEFSNTVKKAFKTPKPKTPRIKDKQTYKENEWDSDGTLSSVTEKLSKISIPKSENEIDGKTPSTDISEKNPFSYAFLKEGGMCKSSSLKVISEQEYAALFPSKSMTLSSTDQKVYGLKLFKFFNEKIFRSELPADMNLVWTGALLKTAGMTYCSRKRGVRSCHIKLSSKLLIFFDRLQDTLLHEMCHAAVWLISESGEKHGPLWKSWASKCKQVLPFVDCPERCHTYEVPYRVWYQCINCKWKIGRCKQSQKLQKSVCKKCKTPVTVMTN